MIEIYNLILKNLCNFVFFYYNTVFNSPGKLRHLDNFTVSDQPEYRGQIFSRALFTITPLSPFLPQYPPHIHHKIQQSTVQSFSFKKILKF